MKRDAASHKGENGNVTVIGGSRHQHGAPLFSALAAEAGGVDLLHVCLPACHEGVAKAQSLNFQVRPFRGDDLAKADVDGVLELLATADAAVLGPGIARSRESIDALHALVDAAPCPVVLDATALQPWTLDAVRGKTAVLTPHAGELERMGSTADSLVASLPHGTVYVVKGREDLVCTEGRQERIHGGNAGLTVGGTGDALAGLIASLIAQGFDSFDACTTASTVLKRAGTVLYETKGYAYTTSDVIDAIPGLLRSLP